MKGAIIIGLLFVTFIAWIPNHAASYLGDQSDITGGFCLCSSVMPCAFCIPRHCMEAGLEQGHFFLSVFCLVAPCNAFASLHCMVASSGTGAGGSVTAMTISEALLQIVTDSSSTEADPSSANSPARSNLWHGGGGRGQKTWRQIKQYCVMSKLGLLGSVHIFQFVLPLECAHAGSIMLA